MRRMLLPILLSIALIGCETISPPPPTDRESKLLTLAAGEAQQINNARERLTRQLNFAHIQMQRSQPTEAKQSLEYAAKTLREAKPNELNSQTRIAGWVSISELSRLGNDKPTAQSACDQAVQTLRQITPITERPNYVIGVANEVKALQGKAAAAKLLEESAPWIKPMQRVASRRLALTHIADAIFDNDDMPGGLELLRTENDATWRSDTLAMLAESQYTTCRDANGNVMARQTELSQSSVGGLVARNIPAPITTDDAFSDKRTPTTDPTLVDYSDVPMDFSSNFKQSNTSMQQRP